MKQEELRRRLAAAAVSTPAYLTPTTALLQCSAALEKLANRHGQPLALPPSLLPPPL